MLGHDSILTLQDLEVLDVGIFGVDVELDAGHGHIAKNAVVYLAEGGAKSSPLELVFFSHVPSTTFIGRRRRGSRYWVSSRTYPVPHCSTLVILSWRRLFSHARSS